MFLKLIKLVNFRNYSNQAFKFENQITVLVGDNAMGKSNFLESIYFLATSKSEKAEKDEELIKYGKDFVRIEGEISNEQSAKLEIGMQIIDGRIKKVIKVNGVSRRLADYSANLAVILFSPEDLNLVTLSPSLRRVHIDSVLSQIDKQYKKNLSAYENMVIRKNRLLKRIKEGFAKISELDFWTEQQILLGSLITEKRKSFFEFINGIEKKNLGDFSFEYLPNEVTINRLKEYEAREIDATTSLIGPHRDDFLFLLNEKDLAKFGSRGEQRSAVLDLKLTEVQFVESILGDRPILLLDDIFSELDFSHRQHVVDFSNLQQTIIATVDWDKFLEKALENAKITFVESGKLVEKVDK